MEFHSPYAEVIGAHPNRATGEPILSVSWRPEIEGRPGFIHGGVIAGLLEMACYEALAQEMRVTGLPKVETHAVAQIIRIGKRVANASAVCWQDDRSKPIATARMHILLDR
jgi:acyl-coenzyme A thioesterase PaaI-like protein